MFVRIKKGRIKDPISTVSSCQLKGTPKRKKKRDAQLDTPNSELFK